MNQEKKITELLLKADEKLRKQYDTLIRELLNATGEIPKGITTEEMFSIAKHCPLALRKKIEALLNNYQAQLLNTIQAGITQAVLLSSENSQSVFNGMTNFDEETTAAWRNDVSKAFQEQRMRNMGGLNLSDRVWNYTQQTKSEFELAMSQSIEDALKKGKSAEQLGRAVREKLNNPDMMYRRYHLKKLMSDGSKKDVVEWRRRVIGKDGKVRFVKEDLAKVGTGVYRSARQNGLRLAMTEINLAYNYANCKRWSNEPFVLGIRIRLSGNHPEYDICDELQGDYPRDFDFTGWHPRCRCSMSPIMMKRDSEEWKKLRALPQAEYENYISPNAIKDFPKGFKKWCEANKEKLVAAAKREKLPYFVRNNKDSVEAIIKSDLTEKFVDGSDIDFMELSKLKKVGEMSPISNMSDEKLKSTIFEFVEKNPTFFKKPIKDIVFQCERIAGTERHKNHLVLQISNSSEQPLYLKNELKNAFETISKGKKLTLNQEYAMQTLWHELLHCHAPAWKGKKVAEVTPIMETFNEFCARETYDQFISSYGGKATHKEEILKQGVGYNNNIQNLFALLDKLGISKKTVLKNSFQILSKTNYDDIIMNTYKRIIKRKITLEKYEELIKCIDYNVDVFKSDYL